MRVRGEGAEHQCRLEVGQNTSAVCDQEGAAAWRGLEADEGGKGGGECPRGVVVQPDVRGRQRLSGEASSLRDYHIPIVGGDTSWILLAVSAW